MARRARFARHSLRSSPRCSAYCSILTQKKSNMAGACKRRTLPPCLPIALAPLCSGGSVPKAVVGAPSHGCLRCRPGRGVSLKDLNGKSTGVHREGSLRKPRRMQSTRDFFSGRVCGCRFEKMVRRLHSLRRYGDVRLISNTRRSASKNYVVKKKESRIHFFFCNHLLPLSSLFHVCSLRSVMID